MRHAVLRWNSLLFALAIISIVVFAGRDLASSAFANRGSVELLSGLAPATQPKFPAPAVLVFGDAGQIASAEKSFDQALSWKATNLRARYNKGLVSALRGDFQTALEIFNALSPLYPQNRLVDLQLGDAQSGLGNQGQAIVSWQKTEAPRIFLSRADRNLALGEIEQAEMNLQLAGELLSDTDCHAWRNLGDLYKRLGRAYAGDPQQDQLELTVQRSEAAYAQAIALCPAQTKFRIELATIYRDFGQTEKSIQQLEKVIELGTPVMQAWAYAELGTTYKSMKLRDEAVAAYSTALEMQPDWANYRIMLATTVRDQGSLELSLAELQEASHTDNEAWRAWAYLELANTYLGAGDLEQAGVFYEKVLELQPDNETAKLQIERLKE